MIPMSELVRDPNYRRYLETKPKEPPISRDPRLQQSPPWVVFVQREAGGKWGKKEFWKYSEAFKFMAKALKAKVHDATIHNKRVAFDPPGRFVKIKGQYVTGSDGKRRQATKIVPWKPRLADGDPDHHWCRYCRRPTVFRYYRKHKALKMSHPIDSTVTRCCICGSSSRIALMPNDRRA